MSEQFGADRIAEVRAQWDLVRNHQLVGNDAEAPWSDVLGALDALEEARRQAYHAGQRTVAMIQERDAFRAALQEMVQLWNTICYDALGSGQPVAVARAAKLLEGDKR